MKGEKRKTDNLNGAATTQTIRYPQVTTSYVVLNLTFKITVHKLAGLLPSHQPLYSSRFANFLFLFS